jgi:Dipeptidyl aminopeptidases/acylaminoacyl-peptidases
MNAPIAAQPAPSNTLAASKASDRDAAGELTFERVFASPSLDGPKPRGVKVSPDGRWLTLLRNRAEDRERYDLWGYDRESGEWTMLVDSQKLGSSREISEAEKMQRERQRIGDLKGIISYDWNEDGKALLVPLEGNLYLARLDGTATPLTDSENGTLNAVLSPKGQYLSYVRDRRLYVGRPEKGGQVPITPEEAVDTVHWGEAEFVAQEEMARMTGYWWAPDEAHIAVERFDEAPVKIVTRAAIGASGTRIYEQRYPAAGTPNVMVSLWVMKPDGSTRAKVDLGSDPDIYLARVDWASDGQTLYVQRQNREQTRLDMLAVDPKTGASRVLFTETAREKSWVNLSDSYRFLKDESLIWWSERSGYGHLYRYEKGQWAALTSGDWVVSKLVGVDQASGRLFFTANKDDTLAPQVYSLDYRAKGAEPVRLTDLDFVNDASASKDGHTLVIDRSSVSQPPQSYIADANGKRLAWVEENGLGADHPYAPYLDRHTKPTFGTVKAEDGTVLHWKMIKPPHMKPGKRYPVFFEHYGGPHAQTVTRAWTGGLAQAIAGMGYIFFELDNRGSAQRGVEFESRIWHDMGNAEVADQRAGAYYLKSLPFVDPAKIATYGWSYGGYMTLKMLAADHGLYAAGISGAPVTKWELYDTHYTERYMGNPNGDAAAYAKANAIDDAVKITDPLLLLHGMSDDNVVFENSTELIATLQANGRPFEMMLYPGKTHAVRGPEISPHVWHTIFGFLGRHGVLPPE